MPEATACRPCLEGFVQGPTKSYTDPARQGLPVPLYGWELRYEKSGGLAQGHTAGAGWVCLSPAMTAGE